MKRVIFVGQAMPRHKEELHDWPSLNAWLYSVGITDEQIRKNFFYTALVDYFPGSKGGTHLVPTQDEIRKEHKRLVQDMHDFNPDVVVPIGKLSISECLQKEFNALHEDIGKIFHADPYQALGKPLPIIPFPHPSGASTWRHKPENKLLLAKALELLKEAIT